MSFVKLKQVEEKEIVPGFFARFVHSENMTFAYWRVEAGASLPEHTHPHEQVFNITDGEFQLTIEGETRIMVPGEMAIIPGNAPHTGKAITACKLIDVFHPIRQEYK